MITLDAYKEKTVAVMGLGASGLATLKALRAGGATVLAWDDAPERRATAAGLGASVQDLAAAGFGDAILLVLSPGIPLNHPAPHPAVARARRDGVPITGDVALLRAAQGDAFFIAITGTNGKSTTTALAGHLLRQAGRPVQVGGNLGRPAVDLDPLGAGGIYVLELSSYQLDLLDDPGFDVAVLLNISPDHLDRHGGLAGYIAAKRRIFEGRKFGDVAIVGADDAHCRAILDTLREDHERTVIAVSGCDAGPRRIFADASGRLIETTQGRERAIADLSASLTLRGTHNRQNAAAAAAVARTVGLSVKEVAAGLESFPGLAHRQELVARKGDLLFVNDSKATNGAAAARALQSYDSVFWILGGRDKADGLGEAIDHLAAVRHAYAIGEAGPDFAGRLKGRVPVTLSRDLATALGDAERDASGDPQAGEKVILLSPAAASFDQFRNFEERGDCFRALVLGEAAA